MTSDAINLEGVSAKQLTLLDDKCLVRVMPREEVRSSGLLVLHGRPEHQVGTEFYGEVVAVGPGTLVRGGPTPDEVAEFVRDMVRELVTCDGSTLPEFSGLEPDECAEKAREFMERRRPMRRVPPPWKPGDHVLAKQGFGVEMDLREGRHHVIERAGEFGHGILAAWDPAHAHCWHWDPHDSAYAFCACGANRPVGTDLQTRLPACASCPSGERLAEAVLGRKDIYDAEVRDAPEARSFDPDRPGGFSVGELRPE